MKMRDENGTLGKGFCSVDSDVTLHNGRLDDFTRNVGRKNVTFAHNQ